jgi:hypothetical protein
MPTQRRSVEATITSNCYLSDLHHADGRTSRLAELRLWVTVFIGAPGGQQKRLQFLLDSGAPVSFIPYREWNRLGLKWEKLVRWTRSTPPQVRPEEAFGAPCDLGLVDVWLPHRSDLSDLRGPFPMNARRRVRKRTYQNALTCRSADVEMIDTIPSAPSRAFSYLVFRRRG